MIIQAKVRFLSTSLAFLHSFLDGNEATCTPPFASWLSPIDGAASVFNRRRLEPGWCFLLVEIRDLKDFVLHKWQNHQHV